MYLTPPVPTGRGSSRIPLQRCLDAFVKEEVMEKTDAWYVALAFHFFAKCIK